MQLYPCYAAWVSPWALASNLCRALSSPNLYWTVKVTPCESVIPFQQLLTGHWCNVIQSGTTITVLKMPKIFTSQENRTKLPDRSDGSTRCFEAPFASSPFQCFISDRRSITSARWQNSWLFKFHTKLGFKLWITLVHPFWFSVNLSLFCLIQWILSHQNHKVFNMSPQSF